MRTQLEDALHLSAQDLKYSSSTIQADLDRFQRQKVADLREMTISMARSHRDWCKKVRREPLFTLRMMLMVGPHAELGGMGGGQGGDCEDSGPPEPAA